MALITTQDAYERSLRSRSLILNYDPSKRSSKNRIASTRTLDLSERGIKQQLFELNSTDTDHWGDPVGYLPSRRRELKTALQNWETFKSSQPQMDKTAPPVGIWLERINRLRAQIRIGEEESRALSKMATAIQAEEPVERGARAKAAQKGHCKFINGKIRFCGGRPVVENEKGVSVFEDSGEPIADYLANLKGAKHAANGSSNQAGVERSGRPSSDPKGEDAPQSAACENMPKPKGSRKLKEKKNEQRKS